MQISAAKESILKKIRQALTHSTPVPFPQSDATASVFQPSSQELEIQFAEQFTKLQGKFVYCADVAELIATLKQLADQKGWGKIHFRTEDAALSQLLKDQITPHDNLATCDASITRCDYLIARTGTIVLSSVEASGRTTSVYAPIHICIATTKQLVYDIKDGLQLIRDQYNQQLPSLISFATGPSRTADIEKTLVVGVHGPKEVYCFLLDQG
ncbi:MAG: lactate utilization protein [Chitinophagaceae bacterium]|nr:lactate utilization protein [Chitinophagaceae bacterium]